MRKSVSTIAVIAIVLILGLFLMLKSCIIQNPKAEECEVLKIEVSKMTIGGVNDIVFHNADKDYYYINRGLEQGLNLDSLKTKVLNKTVTLHLAKVLSGVTSKHISQMTLGDEIIYTEFSTN
jgi:uncharacterized protein YpmB